MSNDNQATGHNLDTSDGARAYVAEFFANQVRRHDFRAYITTRLAADFACALAKHLAAQPSPTDTGIPTSPSLAGQGDALLESLVVRWRAEAAGAATIDNTLCQKIANCTMRHAGELKDALAARQPVAAVPSIDYEDLVDQAKDLVQCGCSVNGAFDWLLEQLTDSEAPAAPPAQAVDLTEVRFALDAAEGLAVACASVDGFSREEIAAAGGEMRKQFADARALIDSQAVRNG